MSPNIKKNILPGNNQRALNYIKYFGLFWLLVAAFSLLYAHKTYAAGTCSGGSGGFMCGWDASSYTGGHNPGSPPDEIEFDGQYSSVVYPGQTLNFTIRYRAHHSTPENVYTWLNINGHYDSYYCLPAPGSYCNNSTTDAYGGSGDNWGMPGGITTDATNSFADYGRCLEVLPLSADSAYNSFYSCHGSSVSDGLLGASVVMHNTGYSPPGWREYKVSIKINPNFKPQSQPGGEKAFCARPHISVDGTYGWPGSPRYGNFSKVYGATRDLSNPPPGSINRLDNLRAVSGGSNWGETNQRCYTIKNPPAPPDANCNLYTRNFVKDDPSSSGTALYRVTLYGRDQNYVASSPPNNQIRSSRGPWKTFTAAPVAQSGEIKVGDFYNDGIFRYNPASSGDNFRLTFPAPAGPDWKIYIEKWDHTKDHNGKGGIDWQYGSLTQAETNCYSASCQITIYNGAGLPANGVFGGQPFLVSTRLRNTGRDDLPQNSRGAGLAASTPPGNWGPRQDYASGGIPRDGLTDIYFWLDAPADVASRSFSSYADYYGLFALGGGCGATVNTYMPFNINPYARIDSIDDEDPREVKYTVGGRNDGWSVNVPWGRQLYVKNPDGSFKTVLDGPRGNVTNFPTGGNTEESPTYGNSTTPLTPIPVAPGDYICAWSHITPTDGWVGPGNDIRLESTKGNPPNPAEYCEIIADKPYLRTYGADVLAGSGFMAGESCSPSTGGIKAYNSKQADRSGSGAQFAALATGAISDFTSASLRPASLVPTYRNGLSFANFPSPLLGQYKGLPVCATDFYGTTKFEDAKITSRSTTSHQISNGLFKDGKQTSFNEAGAPNFKLKLTGTPPGDPFSNHHSIYVDGDLVITGDIELKNFTEALKAPSLAIIVKGDIYVQSNVKRLDGLFVAQKRGNGSGGTIYTCTNGSNPYDANAGGGTALIANCSDQLTVNGAFVANSVKLLRTYKSLRDSKANPDEVADGSQAAEVFNFMPELYLSPPPFNNGAFDDKAQSYETLPPIL